MSIAAPETVLVAGDAGPIETLIETPSAIPVRAVAVCCHPHPLFGGSLTNKVIHTVARTAVAAGAEAIRFNFRGVGRSAGNHDEGRGELADLIVVARWARARHPEAPLWLAGFSFGAWITLRAHALLNPSRLLSVAPPVGRWDFSDVSRPACPWLIVQGERDELVDASTVTSWAENLDADVVIHRLSDADHFFHGRLHELRDVVMEFLTSDDSRRASR